VGENGKTRGRVLVVDDEARLLTSVEISHVWPGLM